MSQTQAGAVALPNQPGGSVLGRTFERLGMLPVLIVMYLLFYGLKYRYSLIKSWNGGIDMVFLRIF